MSITYIYKYTCIHIYVLSSIQFHILDNTTISTLYRYCLYMKLAAAANSMRSAKDELSHIQSGRCINIDYLSESSWINTSSEISEEQKRNILTTLLIE